jgi:hypothetical protein
LEKLKRLNYAASGHLFLAVTKWTAVFTLLSLFAGCSPVLTPRREPVQPTFYGEWRGHPEDRLVAFGALPPAPILNPRINLSGGGGKLLVSNDPEYLTDAAVLPGALYRDELVGGFRVFYHHANSTQVDLTLATAVTNAQAAPLLLFTRGSGQGVNLYPDVAGQGAFKGYLRTRDQLTLLATLAPGESVLVVPTVVGPAHTVSALEEYVAVTPPRDAAARIPSLELIRALEAASLEQKAAGASQPKLPAGFSLATVTVTVLAHKGLPPSEPQALPVLAAGPPKPGEGTPYYLLNRGTFPFFDRHAKVPLADTAAMLTLNSAVSGPFARTIRGEYLLGRDAVNGRLGFNNGNYGVVYHLFCVSTDAPIGVPYALLMQPAGGVGHYALQAEGDIVTSPFVSYKSGWWFYRALAFGPEACIPLRAHLTGGAFGPQKFFVVPFPLFGK